MVLAAPGARVNRYKHEAEARFGWNKRQRALMTELLLRGPQTIGELRTHCARLFAFEDLEAVTTGLQSLAEADPPMSRALPREPGRSAIRHIHLMYPERELPGVASEPATPVAVSTAAAASGPAVTVAAAEMTAVAPDAAILEKFQELRSDLDVLRDTVADLSQRLRTIEDQLL
jgi:uncharacterized protein YceH (UPF0502 family)